MLSVQPNSGSTVPIPRGQIEGKEADVVPDEGPVEEYFGQFTESLASRELPLVGYEVKGEPRGFAECYDCNEAVQPW